MLASGRRSLLRKDAITDLRNTLTAIEACSGDSSSINPLKLRIEEAVVEADRAGLISETGKELLRVADSEPPRLDKIVETTDYLLKTRQFKKTTIVSISNLRKPPYGAVPVLESLLLALSMLDLDDADDEPDQQKWKYPLCEIVHDSAGEVLAKIA